MVLIIKDADAHRLAQQLAQATGENLTDAVIGAIRARLAAVQRQDERPALLSEVAKIQEFVRSLPDRDPRPAEELLGYDRFGLPG